MNLSFEIIAVHGSNAESTWNELRTRPGIIPVLMGDRRETDSALEFLRQSSDEATDDVAAGSTCFTPAFDLLTGEPRDEVCFGLIPVEISWLVPAFLKFGGWNDCPEASVHLAFFHHRFERYGAQVVTVTDDVIEFRVSRPPRTKEEAKQLALEQYVYCTDIVDQGVGTPGNLQATLIDSPNWFFWWD